MVYPGFQHAVNLSSPAIALMLLAMPALAQEPKDSVSTPHQVAHCIMKRLRADRTESYRDAFKNCKQDLAATPDHKVDTAMNTPNDVVTTTPD